MALVSNEERHLSLITVMTVFGTTDETARVVKQSGWAISLLARISDLSYMRQAQGSGDLNSVTFQVNDDKPSAGG